MRCSKCGAEIANDSKFCEFCGTKVKPDKQRRLIYVMAGIIVILGIIVGLGMYNNQKNDNVDFDEVFAEPDTVCLEEEDSFVEQTEEQVDMITEEMQNSAAEKQSASSQKVEMNTVDNKSMNQEKKTSAKTNSGTSNAKVQIDDDEQAREELANVLSGTKNLSDALSSTKITFKEGDDKPIISDYNDNINRTVTILKNNPKLSLQIEGYMTNDGPEENNRDLARRRANNVRDLFIKKGVNPAQISTASYTVPESNEASEHTNCAVFRIIVK